MRQKVNAHSAHCWITQGNHRIMKVLFFRSKNFGGTMRSSDVLHKTHPTEFGIILNGEKVNIGQHFCASFTNPDISFDQNCSDCSSIRHNAPDIMTRSGCSNFSIAKWGFLEIQIRILVWIAVKINLSLKTKP